MLVLLLGFATAPAGALDEPEDARIATDYSWRTGDDPSFLDADDGWTRGGDGSRAFDNWTGVGWFRFFLDVEPARLGAPVALDLRHLGPIEVYFDGELVARRGQPSARPEQEVPATDAPDDLLLVTPRAERGSIVDDRSRHLLTIRYSSHFLDSFRWRGRSPALFVQAADADDLLAWRLRARGLRTTHRMLLGGASIAFALPFLAIAGLRRRVDFSTWFGIVALMVAFCVLTNFAEPTSNPEHSLRWSSLFLVAFIGLAYSIVRLLHSDHEDGRWIHRSFGVAGAALVFAGLLQPFRVENALLLYMLCANAEVVRSLVARRRHTDSLDTSFGDGSDGGWLVTLGAVPIVVTGIYSLLVGLGLVPELIDFFVVPAPYYASLILMASMAVHLALDFVRTRRRLRQQLVRVQELSDEALEQERRARRGAVERARLEAEHARKSAELDEARVLQLSMLPETLPSPPGLDLAVDTRTATEVGGDYYDAALEPDGALLLAVGDAAGHGVQAGTVVAATKSLVQASVGDADAPAERLERMARALKRSGLRRRHMALLLVRVTADGDTAYRVELTGAAMPPAYVTRASGEVETIELPGLPLGSFSVGPYASTTRLLRAGDALVCLSDGMVESSASDGRPFGFERLERAVTTAAAAAPTAAALIARLRGAVDTFTGGAELEDDRTVLALRISSQTEAVAERTRR